MCLVATDYQLKRTTIHQPSTYHIHKDQVVAIAVAAKVAGRSTTLQREFCHFNF